MIPRHRDLLFAPFDVRAEREKCAKNCTLCVRTCPSLAIDLHSLERGRSTRPSCSLCGRCIDACNKEALHFHVKGTEVARIRTRPGCRSSSPPSSS